MINIKVTEIINAPKFRAFRAVCDFRSYGKWWVIPINVRNSDLGYLEFKPLIFITIGIKVLAKEIDTEVQFDYVKGPFRGHGIWKFKELENGKTQVSYEIFLSPVNFVYRFASSTQFFTRKHIKDIRIIIKRIKKAPNRMWFQHK